MFLGFVEDAWDATGGQVVDAAEEGWDAASDWVEETIDDAGTFVEQTAEDAGDWFASTAEDIGEWAGETALDGLDWFAGGLEDVGAFDLLDTATFGAVDLSYEDGQFNANVGIDGVAELGFSIGEQGVSGEVDTLVFDAGASYDGSNIAANIAAGIDAPYLPYVAADVQAGEDGFAISGEAQATVPTPWGLVGGEVEGQAYQNEDGSWGVGGQVGGTYTSPSGLEVGGEVGASYMETADGDSVFNAHASGEVGIIGGPHVGAGVGYTHAEIDGTTTDSVDASVNASGYGFEVEAGGNYTHAVDADGNEMTSVSGSVDASGYGVEVGAEGQYQELEFADGTSVTTTSGSVSAEGYGAGITAGGSETTVVDASGNATTTSDTWADVDGFDTGALMEAAGGLIEGATGQSGISEGMGAVQDMASTVSNLAGAGDLSDALSTMADSAGGSVMDVAGDLAESANFDDFSSDVIESEVSEAAADEVWDDLGS